ncbi:hypothetical protein HYV49_03575 [Candidatus Pacearchaeota archaeon]|nr:hypothetical protein [Candidatus Pacearchaeota archaeon]
MREFIYFSRSAPTNGNFPDDLMKAGRLDIACHVIINAFFVSKRIRDNVGMHLVFYGMPNPPKHLEMYPSIVIPETGKAYGKDNIDISKKDIAGLIKRMLYKYKKDKRTEVYPGYFIEKKNLFKVVDDFKSKGKTVYLLDGKGDDIRNIEIDKDPVFLLGDHDGLPSKELKRLKQKTKPVSLGKTTYFASQSMTIVQHELDRRGIG